MNQRTQVKLGVNIDHVATVRQARGTQYPSPVEAALICQSAGAHGITVHLREDRRHIQDDDVRALRAVLSVPLNLEMGNAPDIVEAALDIVPEEVCLVPEKREELTTEGGLDVAGNRATLGRTVRRLEEKGIVVSLFIDPEVAQIEAAAELKVPFIELHTGHYCDASPADAERKLNSLVEAAELAHSHGLRVNAGHGINLQNIDGILRIPFLNTLNIGHSIVARAVLVGMGAAVNEMLNAFARDCDDAERKGYPL
ncbi:MAG: pyridoxine 5'-phosphate synthase [Verrucomicrobia bacterium]|nr:pyridoxine 5'-phosphate synthase [Verrucomicrobiota bacterium]